VILGWNDTCITTEVPGRKRGDKMSGRKKQKALATGDRARDKRTRRVGTIEDVKDVNGNQELALSYDEQPQDTYLTTPAREGAQLPPELIERE
jgi:hypothetical protein